MTVEYILQGLSCANCAAQIENAVTSANGVLSANVNLFSSTLKAEISCDSDMGRERFFVLVKKIVHKYEPDIVVLDTRSADRKILLRESSKKEINYEIVSLIFGAIIYMIGIATDKIFGMEFAVAAGFYISAYSILGWKVVLHALKNIVRGRVFDENFLMSVATMGAFATGNLSEAVAVMLFYQIGEFFQESAVRRSKKSIADLMDIRPDYANLISDGEITKAAPDDIGTGALILIKPGEKIPLDGVVTNGESMIDVSALTGESVPRVVRQSDNVLSGCINLNGVLTVEVTKPYAESTVAKIIDLVENASGNKAATESFITAFSRVYTPVVVVMAALLALIPPLAFGASWNEWIGKGLMFLVVSCPCALVISIPLGFFGGIGCASKKGILIKGGNYLEALNKLETVVFDKTGTLTKGVFGVTNLIPAEGWTNEKLLETAAIAEAFSNHPIAVSIIKAYGKPIDREAIHDYNETAGLGVGVTVGGKKIFAGGQSLMQRESIHFTESFEVGTKLYAAVDGEYIGCIIISDEIKPDSREAVDKLKSRGIRVVMLTGDNEQIAEAVAADLNINEVYAGLLPAGKVETAKKLMKEKSIKGKLAFVGDGVNDAPVLAGADIGIAMGGLGSDAAIEAADIALMTDEPSKIIEAMQIAAFTRRIVWQNIFFALAVKALCLLLGAFGIASMWEAVFADVGVAVLAIMNSMRVLKMK